MTSEQIDYSFLSGTNARFLEEQLKKFQQNPSQVPQDIATFFRNTQDLQQIQKESPKKYNNQYLQNGDFINAIDYQDTQTEENISKNLKSHAEKFSIEVQIAARDSIRAMMLIRSYRVRGHLVADLDPLNLRHKTNLEELKPENYGFEKKDLNKPIFINNIFGKKYITVNEIIEKMRKTYCGQFAVEYVHITNAEEKNWLQSKVEPPAKIMQFTEEGKKAILKKIIKAEYFEKTLARKYIATKRFGLDGGESLIAAVEQVIKRGGASGVKQIVIAMSHRGRLNMLCNVMGKKPVAVFHEFESVAQQPDEGSGDVKYHLGYSSDREFDGNKVHLSLCANPSHLEAVNPIALGKCRGKQDQEQDKYNRTSILPLIVHGDAAFAGQGVTAECFGLSSLKGHRVGGSIHFIVNNQIGFTTNPLLARSSAYASDVAKIVEAPIFHVNGDNPEAVVFAARLAIEYRQKFAKPVVVDMFCYRRFGHNEADEPLFTQPLMYKKIAKHPTTLEVYTEKLQQQNVIDKNYVEQYKQKYLKQLEEQFNQARSYVNKKPDWLKGSWAEVKVTKNDGARRGVTAVDEKKIKYLSNKINILPQDFHFHKNIHKIYKKRYDNILNGQNIDWASAEALAFASVIDDGFGVRLSGQDCERGTFSQRHSVLIDQMSEKKYIPIEKIQSKKAEFEVVNSMLSEEAVLGFEYGYSLANPDILVIWEAQFGDFANGAQVIIDQFIACAETKWLRMSGIVLMLPHGYEGQGPEHSSARVERYLQLCAQDNMQVVNCTTPANFFHVLRRQLCRDFRKPLIIMTPKSILRHKKAVSKIHEFTKNSVFHRVLWDDADILPQTCKLKKDHDIEKLVLCSGKVYYELFEERQKRNVDNVYFMRLEQLYPFPKTVLKEEMSRFPNAEIIWCQEEHKNMGAWNFVMPLLCELLQNSNRKQIFPKYIGRPEAAASATGNFARHQNEINEFMKKIFSN